MMMFLREHAPEFAQRMERLNEVRPEAAEGAMARLRPRLRDAMGGFERDPALGKARLDELLAGMEVAESVRAYRGAARRDPDSPETAAAADAVRAAVDRGFQARLRVAEQEIASLEAKIESLRSEIAARQTERDDEVKEKTDELLQRAMEDRPPPGE